MICNDKIAIFKPNLKYCFKGTSKNYSSFDYAQDVPVFSKRNLDMVSSSNHETGVFRGALIFEWEALLTDIETSC